MRPLKKMATMTSLRISSLAALLLLLMVVNSCSDDYGDPKVPDNIKTGPVVQVTSSTVGQEGATIEVSKPGTPVDGLKILVPAGAFSTGQTVAVSYSEIESHEFGTHFNPVSPMITIACDGGYSAQIMEVTVPVTLPEGHIPIGFFLDKSTGKLEGIPFSQITPNSITLTTRHFLSGNMLRPDASTLKSGKVEKNGGANIIVSSISESLLYAQPIISSGFKPGTDDWEFPNYGSYLAPGGHCSGQNMAAMWYYFEKKATEGSLFNRFSDNTQLWQENAVGYRFCSVLHSDLDWHARVPAFFDKYIDKNQELDKLKLLTIAGTMLVNGEPQGIGVYFIDRNDATGKPIYAGHDLICYQVSVMNGKLYISDPNTPAKQQVIEFGADKFKPYETAANAAAPTYSFPFITYYAKTAYIEWDQIGRRYAEIQNLSIGNNPPNTFPPYTIYVKDKTERELTDTFTINGDTLRCVVVCPTTQRGFRVNDRWQIWFDAFDTDGNQVSVYESKGQAYVKLKPGLNTIGFYIRSQRNNLTYDDGTYIPLFIDFKWFNIYLSKLRIEPDPIAAEPGKDVTITARTDGSAPKDARYVWDFGDGSKEVTVNNDSTVVHKFAKKGDYRVTVKLYDNKSGAIVGQATAMANILEGMLDDLHKCKYVRISLSAEFKTNLSWTQFTGFDFSSGPRMGSSVKYPMTWNGTKFSAEFGYSYIFGESSPATYTGKISGEMTADGLSVKTITGEYNLRIDRSDGVLEKREYKVTLANLPFDVTMPFGDTEPMFRVTGPPAATHVTSLEVHYTLTDDEGTGSMVIDRISYLENSFVYVSFWGMFD